MFNLLIMGLAGFGVYAFAKQKQVANPTIPTQGPAKGATTGAQPSQQYPFKMTQPVRVDNANQPWYAGSKQAMQGPADNVKATDILQQGSTVIHSMSDVWGTMSNWFGADTTGDSYDLANTDSIDGMYDNMYTDMSGSGVDSSNIVGDQMMDQLGNYDDSYNWDQGNIA